MKKILLIIFLTFLVLTPKVFAQDKFSTSYSTVYNVLDSGITQVTSSIQVKNNTTDYFVSSYSVQTAFRNISNIQIIDSGGKVAYKTSQNDAGILIIFKFNKNVVGINNSQDFTVSYQTPDISNLEGNVWEVNIPGIADQSSYASFSTEVKVPQDFGPASIIKPYPSDLRTINEHDLIFSKSDLGSSGISISYGDYQVYDFNLKYQLSNKNLLPTTTEIALPSNNNYQDINIKDITPKPYNVYIDKDGNWLAQFKLSPNSERDVLVTGQAKVLSAPRKESLTDDEKNLYVVSQKYWEVNDPEVQALGKSLKTPEAIYNYVVTTLKYDSKRVSDNQVRAGASKVLKKPNSAVCLEFTDLFIALSRAAGIPAREVEGFANTNNSANRPLSLEKDVLHAWPEYYDFGKGAWIMVDPTWQNTTGGVDYFNVFDFDHFAFVINGQDSSYPIPAGGYKIPGQDVQDVSVVESKDFDNATPVLTASSAFSNNYLAGFSVDGTIEITNLSGVLAPNQTFKLSSSKQTPSPQYLYFDQIPPFGNKTVSFKFSSSSLLTNRQDTIKIMIGKEVIEKQIQISPFYKNLYFYIIGGVLIGSILVGVSIIARKSRRISVS